MAGRAAGGGGVGGRGVGRGRPRGRGRGRRLIDRADPAVGVVIPTWNEVVRLPRLLDALAACDPGPVDVAVADGGSDDGTRDLARRRARLVDAPRGRAAQQNAGAAAVKGSILWFLHADSVPPPDAVDAILAAVDAGAPGGAFRIVFHAAERARHPLLPLVERGIDARTRVTRTATGDQGIFVRRDVFEALGGFPALPIMEDVALFAALGERGRPAILRGPLATSPRRWLDEGPARAMARMWGLRIGWWAGVDPGRLARWWRHRPVG